MTEAHAILAKAAETLPPDFVALRRSIHAEHELGLHTRKTTSKVSEALAGLHLEFRAGRDL